MYDQFNLMHQAQFIQKKSLRPNEHRVFSSVAIHSTSTGRNLEQNLNVARCARPSATTDWRGEKTEQRHSKIQMHRPRSTFYVKEEKLVAAAPLVVLCGRERQLNKSWAGSEIYWIKNRVHVIKSFFSLFVWDRERDTGGLQSTRASVWIFILSIIRGRVPPLLWLGTGPNC